MVNWKGTSMWYQDPVLSAWLEIFHPYEVPVLNSTFLLSYIFRLNTLKGTVKAPAVDLQTLSTLRGTEARL